MDYRREIDGLRAVAVLPVILFHAGIGPFAGGFVGVDVFFVISGYLITSIIVAERQAGRFSLVDFYERRARRILPALFVVMAACLPLAWLWLLPNDLRDFARSVVAVSTFWSNILFHREAGYFDTAAELKPLLHTWSLAVEEQYYLLFPLLLLAVWRQGMRRVAITIGILALASLALAQWALDRYPAAAFFLLPSRLWELALGALVALYLISGPQREPSGGLRNAASAAGLAMIAAAVFVYDGDTPFPGAAALLPTIGTALVIVFATPATLAGRLLAHRALVGIGLLSYSAYLWHHPLFAFARHRLAGEVPIWLAGTLAAASLVLAYVTWRFVEQPMRRRDRVRRPAVFALAGLVSLSFVVLGLVGIRTDGFESYYVQHRLSDGERELYVLLREHTASATELKRFDDGACRFSSEVVDEHFESRFERCAATHGRAVVVLGDSHGINVYNIVAKAGVSDFIVGVVQGGCRPHRHRPRCQYEGFDRFVDRWSSAIASVIFHQSGSYFLRDREGRVDSPAAFAPDAAFVVDEPNVAKVMEYLERLGAQVPTVWLGPFVEARVDFRDFRLLKGGLLINERSLDHFGRLDRWLIARVDELPRSFAYVSLVDIIGAQREFLRVGSCITYRDRDHFSACGEDLVARQVKVAYDAGAFVVPH
ncbi:acyltransferase family protein [Azohydromonas sediminis]|uniref:acyltransferase family protein n=1 Tax=Azohydromonas sediminis TaxID=2259674 RepID=UPI000E65C8ED|nr:acyltransferase family protein [Azohydromonas sediminis]